MLDLPPWVERPIEQGTLPGVGATFLGNDVALRHLSLSSIRRALSGLVRKGYVERVGPGVFRRAR